MPHLHFVMDAYETIEAQGDDMKLVNEILARVPYQLDIAPIMPPVLIPYYYCEESEDVGISGFVFLKNGHMTIHTFPKRSCYFVDILSESFYSRTQAEEMIIDYINAEEVKSNLIDRRFSQTIDYQSINESVDFGPHYLVTLKNCDMTMETIFLWLDNVCEKIKVQPISRPFVVYDNPIKPKYISGIIVIAQSHVAVHYDIEKRIAEIDIFSCSFLDDELVTSIFKELGDDIEYQLFARGSKYQHNYIKKEDRLSIFSNWRNNIKK